MEKKLSQHKNDYYLRKNIIALLCIAYILLLYFRTPASFLHPMFWAEDGKRIFAHAYNDGISSLFMSYCGYIAFIPRLVAYVTLVLPYKFIPTAYCYVALFATTICTASILSNRFQYPYKLLLALSFILVPIAGEAIGTLCNIQTSFSPILLFLLFAKRPVNKNQALFDYFTLLLMGLTGPYSLIVLPLFALKYYHEKNKHALKLLIIAMAVSLAQLIVMYHMRHIRDYGNFNFNMNEVLAIIKILYAKFLGMPLLFRHNPKFYKKCISLIILFGMITCVTVSKNKYRFIIWNLLILLTVTTVSTLYGGLNSLTFLASTPFAYSDRYYYLPYIILAWILIFGLNGNFISKASATALLILMLTNTIANFKFNMIGHTDYNWPYYARLLSSMKNLKKHQTLFIPINPANWYIKLKI